MNYFGLCGCRCHPTVASVIGKTITIKKPARSHEAIELEEKLVKARAIIKGLILGASWYSDEHHKAQDFLDCE